MSSPIKFLVQDWLISVPGTELREVIKPPSGPLGCLRCGRFGSRVIEQMKNTNFHVTVIDVHARAPTCLPESILGRGTEAHTLEAAGIADAQGIVAATGDDIDNLSIIMTARNLNPGLFVIARQERRENSALFDSSGADLVALRSRIVARQYCPSSPRHCCSRSCST